MEFNILNTKPTPLETELIGTLKVSLCEYNFGIFEIRVEQEGIVIESDSCYFDFEVASKKFMQKVETLTKEHILHSLNPQGHNI